MNDYTCMVIDGGKGYSREFYYTPYLLEHLETDRLATRLVNRVRSIIN